MSIESNARPLFRVHVSVVVTDKEGRILLVQEAKSECRGQWNLPGGHLDHHEDPVTGATRELREETGLKLPMQALLGVYPRGQSVRFVMRAESNAQIPAPGDEIMAVRWWRREEILMAQDPQLTAAENLRQIVRDLTAGHAFPLAVIRQVTP